MRSTEDVEYRILGPLEVRGNGSLLDLGPHKQRSLLALLLINANRTVATDRILEELWGDEAEGKENALWVYISRLRSVLEPDRSTPTVLITIGRGYSLSVDPGAVDGFRFESAATTGRSAMLDDPEGASETLREALSLWRGDALEDFQYDEFAQAEISRLHELRITALEDRIEADLRLGKAGELIAELDALSNSNPLRERPVSLKMMALYRAGRQADALRTFEKYRRALGEELGIEPSPELGGLEEQILLHDSRLQARMPRRVAVTPTEVGANPFRGLQPFQEDDADTFFGRDRLVAQVVRRLANRQQLVTLVGPSGSGKSSVVRAGVIPALRKDAIPSSDQWLIAQMVPGSHPFAELEAALLRSTIDAPDSLTDQLQGDHTGILRAAMRVLPQDTSKILIVIDQFEELFTLVDDENTRIRFLEGISEAVNEPHGRVMVLVTLRADFYDRPLQYPVFGVPMGEGVVNVVPMTPDELEQAAEEPAARAGVTLEPSLVASLLTDVVGQPGALPLFQYSLTELFDRRAGDILNVDAYEAMGGLRGSLTRRAEDLYSGLTDEQQAASRQLFLRLVTIADTDEWSRRRVPASEIIALDVDIIELQAAIEVYGQARLLTFDRDQVSGSPTVEVAHEALLTEWDRLQGWIDEARGDVRQHARLVTAAAEWKSSGQNPDYLLTGARLAEFEAWAGQSTMSLTATEHEFLDASIAERQARDADEQQREAREAALGRRARLRLWGLAGALLVLAVVAAGLLVAVLAPDPPTIALIEVRPGADSFNQQMTNGLEKAARELDFNAVVFSPTSDPLAELEDFLSTEPEMAIIPDISINEVFGVAADELAERYPETFFVGLDNVLAFSSGPNTLNVSFRSEEGSFLVGAAAALTSQTGTIGFVGGVPIAIDHFRTGFEAGASHVQNQITLLSRNIIGAPWEIWASPQLAKNAAEALYSLDADIIYTAAGQSGEGTLIAAVEGSDDSRYLWGIGVDVDEALFVDPRSRDHLLTSMVIRRDRAIERVINDYLGGTLEPGFLRLGLAEEALSYSTAGDYLDSTTIETLEELKAGIIDGSIVVPTSPAGPASDPPQPDAVLTVDLSNDDCSLSQVPDVMVGEVVELRSLNETRRHQRISIWLFEDGTTESDIEGAGPWTLSPFPFGVTEAFVDPGAFYAVSAELFEAGTWGILCFDEEWDVRVAGVFNVGSS